MAGGPRGAREVIRTDRMLGRVYRTTRGLPARGASRPAPCRRTRPEPAAPVLPGGRVSTSVRRWMCGDVAPPQDAVMSSRIPDPAPRHGVVSRRRTVARAALILLCLVVGLSIPAGARGDSGRWHWPLPDPHRVVRAFEPPEHPYGPGHRGIDIAVSGGLGAPVRAVEAGTVRFAGDVAGRGVLSVLHSDGLISTYEPVEASVREGEVVTAGDRIGVIADVGPSASHCPGEVCLHLGARQGQEYRDPLLLLGARGPSVLLPWSGGGAVPAVPPVTSGARSVPVAGPSATSGAVRVVSPAPTSVGPVVALIE